MSAEETMSFDDALPWACGYAANPTKERRREVKALIEEVIQRGRGLDAALDRARRAEADRDELRAALNHSTTVLGEVAKSSLWHTEVQPEIAHLRGVLARIPARRPDPADAVPATTTCARCDQPIVQHGEHWRHSVHGKRTPCPRAVPAATNEEK